MSSATIKMATFIDVVCDGRAMPGPISVPGVKVGDIIACWNGPNFYNYIENFMPVITVNDEVQQTTTNDLTGITMRFVLIRLS